MMSRIKVFCVYVCIGGASFAGIELAPIDTSVFEWEGKPLKEPVWVDLFTGAVYEIPAKQQVAHSCGITFVRIPVYDSPCLVTERAALDLVPVGE